MDMLVNDLPEKFARTISHTVRTLDSSEAILPPMEDSESLAQLFLIE